MSKTRKRHQKTEYEKQRDKHRNNTSRHVVTFEAKLAPEEIQEIVRINQTVAYIGRRITAEMRKRLEQLQRRNDYAILREEYAKIKKRQEKEPDKAEELEPQLKDIGKKNGKNTKDCRSYFPRNQKNWR